MEEENGVATLVKIQKNKVHLTLSLAKWKTI